MPARKTREPALIEQMLDAAGWTLPSGGTYRQKGGKELDVKFVIPSQVAASEKESKQVQAMLKDNYAEYDRNQTRGIPRPGKALRHKRP